MRKIDRRVQRTRELLQKTLIELIQECEYVEITIQDIVTRANIGRTTFYLHYHSKNDLFTDCHQSMIKGFDSGILYSLSYKELLSPETPQGMIAAYKHLQEGRAHLYTIFQNKESLRKMRDWNAQYIEMMLRKDFAESDSLVPFDMLAHYLAGAQLTFLQWWLEKRRSYTPEKLAQILHRLQRAAVRDAFGMKSE